MQKVWNPDECAVFFRVREQHGLLSNMAGGMPITVGGATFATSEALYQACRFPDRPDHQRNIAGIKNPMQAKFASREVTADTRADWDAVRVDIMRWTLRVKLVANRQAFGEALAETGDLPIVERSSKDPFWGAKLQEDGTLVGENVLGQLLTDLREEFLSSAKGWRRVLPPAGIPNFALFGRPVPTLEE